MDNYYAGKLITVIAEAGFKPPPLFVIRRGRVIAESAGAESVLDLDGREEAVTFGRRTEH